MTRAVSTGRQVKVTRRLAALSICLVALGATGAAAASPDEVATSISYQVMSPYCPGVTLHDCPSDKAIDLRRRIAGWSEAGWGRTRILDHLENEFGASIRAVPDPQTRSGLLAWLLPAAGVLTGIGVFVLLLKRWTRAPAPATAAGPASSIDAAGKARVRDELERFKQGPGRRS